ncbi:MAG TPA: crossover junction endodeoxyribonuclease RuvC [Candidatus Marinimicrobia bacterium]|nr:crossover junction endodeoxyribonuclease RuvC [Candidatus Neomarinimicrobiota bacterium]
MGVGIVDIKNTSFTPVFYDVIKTRPDDSLDHKLETLYDGLLETIQKYAPTVLSIEEAFYGKNARTALLMGHVRGVIMIGGRHSDLPVYEYAARKVKSSVTGNGNATKEQVQFMVQRLLSLKEAPTPLDASDALAIAICHGLNARSQSLK